MAGLIAPILVGPKDKILAAAAEAKVDVTAFRIVDVARSAEAAAAAVALVKNGEANLLMKGSLHTDELLHAVLAPGSTLRTGRRLSHVYLLDVPTYPRPLLVTDAAVNIAPTLEEKADIVQNAVDLAHVMGVARAEGRGAFGGRDGQSRAPIVSRCGGAQQNGRPRPDQGRHRRWSARLRQCSERRSGGGERHCLQGRRSGGHPVVPDLESGNILAKQLIYLARADAAGIVLGASVPIILTSRSDAERTRMASCAVAVLIAHGGAVATPSALGA